MIPGLKADLAALHLRQVERIPFARLSGFLKGKHFVPERHGSSASLWAKSLLEENLRAELQLVYENAKRILGLRHSQIKKQYAEGLGSIDTKLFLFSLDADQDEVDCTQTRLMHRLEVKAPLEELPVAFDSIFPEAFEEIVLPIAERPGFSELIAAFEDIQAERGGSLSDNEDRFQIEYVLPGQAGLLHLDGKKNEVVLCSRQWKGALTLLRAADENFSVFF